MTPAAPLRAPSHPLPGLDTLRALAILLVLGAHYPRAGAPSWFLELTRFGWAGVDLFFVLSGFLIGRQLLAPLTFGEWPRLGDFYLRRLFRILPAYWVALAVYVLVPSARERDSLAAPLVRFLTFTQNLGTRGGAFTHAWSLCIEEQFYLVLPLLVLTLAGRVRARVIAVLVATLVLAGIALRGALWWIYCAPSAGTGDGLPIYWQWIYFPTWSRLDGLLAGVVLAMVQTFRPAVWSRWQRAPLRVALVAVLTLGLAHPLCERTNTLLGAGLVFPVLSLGFAALVVFATSELGSAWLGRVPGARWLAAHAYPLYLSHLLVRTVVCGVFTRHGLDAYHPATMAVLVASILAVAALLHVAVEQPFLRLRDRLRRTASAPVQATAA